MTRIDWAGLLWETRGWLGLEDDEPVPTDELVETAIANGYREREVREALRETNALEAADGSLEYVIESDTDETPKPDESDPERADISTEIPTLEEDETAPIDAVAPTVASWAEADFSTIDAGTWAPDQIAADAWMCRKETKAPYSPWADADAPVECSHTDHEEATTCAECDHHAGYKWGSDGSREHVHGDHDTARKWADMDPTLSSDLVFIQREADDFAFVDGDDVRDPDTGEIHPAFEAILEHLGVTYADISTSGGGVHAVYRGEIPLDGVPEAKFTIDSEPWGANDDEPAVEIYDGKHVCIATGDHVAGTGTEVAEWDDDALRAILEANGYEERPEPSAGASVDLDGYEPTATGSDETTDDIRDIFRALDRLDPKDVGERTIVREWTRGRRSFLPTWGSSGDSGTANYIDDRIWHDTGHAGGYGGPAVMAAIDARLISHRGAEPSDVSGETFFKALEHLRDLGFSIPRLESPKEADSDEEEAETGRDLLALDVVVEPANALAAAAAVEPDDLDEPLPELERDDVDDVAIAVALDDGTIDTPQQFPDDGRYTEAYYRARDHYGAPLPKYLDNSTLEERTDLIFAALERVGPEHVLDGCRSDVTVDDPSGAAIAKLNPTWEDSKRGERILAGYGRGFYCVEHDISFSPIQLAALENGLIFTEADYPRGEAFKQAYRILREEYGAPLPKWRATVLEHVAVLPPAARVLGDSSTGRSLDDARKRTEALLRDAVGVRDRAQLVTNLPGTGKTYGSAIVADQHPILYVAQRNELKAQMEEYAAEIRADDAIDAEPTVRHLPILSAEPFDDVVVGEAVEAVREHGFSLLRDRDALLDTVDLPSDEADDEADDVDLDRPTCPVADGEYGDAWALAVQTARALGIKASKIHEYDTVLFGEPLPCQADGEECPYSLGWEAVRNPDGCADILVGSPGHAYVESATTYYDRDGDEIVKRHRAVVVDEFLDTSYVDAYGDRYLDSATWLARSLAGVETREDLGEADLDGDTWVNLWLDGEGEEYADAADTIDLLDAGRKLCEARQRAGDALEHDRFDTDAPTSADLAAVVDALETFRDASPTDGDLGTVRDRLGSAQLTLTEEADTAYATRSREDAGRLYALADELGNVLEPLSAATEDTDTDDLPDDLATTAERLPVGGDLRALLDDAVDVLRGEDGREGLLEAAATALQGGRDGCRELAIYAEDGYAHPDAWALLAGAIARDTPTVETETFAFDGDEGGQFKHLKANDATIVADKNQHGALVVDQPAFTDATGAKCPVIGLDATGRRELWKIALGRDVERRDIHGSDAGRRGFLRDNGYSIVQTTKDPLPYHGDPDGKNFGEDVELTRTVAEEYTGGGTDAVDDKKPALISTQKVLNRLSPRTYRDTADNTGPLDGYVDAAVNYENMKGSDALGDHQVAVILGSCHYGDAKPEMWGVLAGEDAGRRDTRGDTLDYGSDVANAYLRYMREDTTMQAVLRAGRNDDDTVIFVHTGAVRDDLPTVDEGVVLSAHSKGTLAVASAAKEYRAEPFTVRDLVDAIDGDDRAVGRRQVQNIVADLRDSGYLRVLEDGGHGVDAEYQLDEEPGLGDVELPEPPDGAAETARDADEKTRISDLYTWNFVRSGDGGGGSGVTPPTRPTIPATNTADALADGVGPPG